MNARVSSFFNPLASLAFAVGLSVCLRSVAAEDQPAGLHNFFRATTNIFSGSQPDGEAGFASLAKLGVKTIISVDGSRPDVELAAKFGLHYVHLPFGYDGIPTNRVTELAKAAAVLPGPVYVHCHHGQHRGPAAVSVICLADAGWTPAQAEEFMHKAGTGAEYQGLYRAARDFKAPTPQQLAAVSTNFPSVAKTSTLVDAMVAADNTLENLKQCQSAGWQTPANHPDLTPVHEALMLLEHFREIARLPAVARKPADFQVHLENALKACEILQQQLAAPVVARADAGFKSVTQSCLECHRRYRNQ